MENKDLFLKNVSDYLNIELSEFDCKRLLVYLDEYVGSYVSSLPQPLELPPITIIKKRIVYRYINEGGGKTKVRDFEVKVSPKEIISIVSKVSGVSEDNLLGKRRDSEVLVARHIAMYLIRKESDRTWKITGNYFNRDHTTAIHSYHHVENMIETGNQRYIHLLNEVIPNLPEPIKQPA